jgi:hypothetical protein
VKEVPMKGWRGALAALLLAASVAAGGKEEPKGTEVVGWVSDGHCGAKHMKTGGAACVRKCIAGAVHVNPDYKPGGMVFVTDDKRLWKVDNPDALWGHESEQLAVRATMNEEKGSIKVEEVLRVLQK